MDVNPCAACGCRCRTAHGLPSAGLHSTLGHLVDSLRSDLQEFFMSQLEEVVRPLKAEASTIRLWLARVDRVEPSSKDPVDDKLADLFGPCSPIHLSPSTPPLFASLAAACTPSCESQQCSDKFGGIMDCELPIIKVTTSESIAAHNLSVQSPEGVFTSFKLPKILQDSLSHRIFQRMHGTLNIGKK
jgi:hypothetical protein